MSDAEPLTVGIGWQISTMHGWGVYGLNLVIELAARQQGRPFLMIEPADDLILDPIQRTVLAPFLDGPAQIRAALDASPSQILTTNVAVIHALGNGLTGGEIVGRVRGQPTIGAVFLEDTSLDDSARQRATAFDAIVAGSTWNGEVLRSNGLERVHVSLQGVDTALFHPAPARRLLGNRFVVFSGGKLEYRKGQDIVIAAFKAFHARHPEALLVTAWHNPWPETAASVVLGGHLSGPPTRDAAGRIDLGAWLAAEGLPHGSFLDLGAVPNTRMPTLLREAEVAVFPNRCEGGTNLVAMEAMACGVPCVLSANTGHMDLIAEDRCLPLHDQGACRSPDGRIGVEGWGETPVEAVVEALERCFQDREAARERGAAGASFMETLSWRARVADFVSWLSTV